ncbi:MAG: hypothetical protein QNJ31_04000 [Candidatus Caenarcaniphilales bacterium]|nr:hypothetical protein [Candidatus Caenarcaniphilales bacterium]
MVIHQLASIGLSVGIHLAQPKNKYIPTEKPQNAIAKQLKPQTNLQKIPVPKGFKAITKWREVNSDRRRQVDCNETGIQDKNGNIASVLSASHCWLNGTGVTAAAKKADFIIQVALLIKNSKEVAFFRGVKSAKQPSSGAKCTIPSLGQSGTILSTRGLDTNNNGKFDIKLISPRHYYLNSNGTIKPGHSGFIVLCNDGSKGVIGGGIRLKLNGGLTNIGIVVS